MNPLNLTAGRDMALDGSAQSGVTSHASGSFYQGSRVSGPRGQWPPPFPFGVEAGGGAAGAWLPWLVAGAAVAGAAWFLRR